MTLVVIDKEEIAGAHGIGFVINQKHPSAADGIKNLVCVMNLHGEGLLFCI